MSQQTIVTTAIGHDSLKSAGDKINANFTEVYTAVGTKVQVLPALFIATLASGSTTYQVPFSTTAHSDGSQRYYFRNAGTLQNFYCWCIGNALITSIEFTVMRGVGTASAAATAITATVDPNGNWSFASDVAHTVSIAAGDWIEFRVVCEASGYGITSAGCTVEFLPS